MSRDDLLAQWPEPAAGSPEPPERVAEGAARKSGRPPYPWDDFFIEVIRIANTPDGLPEKQSALEERMMDWCERAWGEKVGESTVRQRVSKIYRAIWSGAET